MRYLLDTHVVIWYYEGSAYLPKRIESLIDNLLNEIYISSVSLWEMAIKMNLGKLKLALPLNEMLDSIRNREFNILQIENAYLEALEYLPFIHKDPFDRFLISTAIAEGLTVVSADENIQKYDVAWVW
ncbi:MAG: type II toxin-antitoxin system VapC family toxin [Clostridiales bacterium]|jgi:PIN domain nuclease of toxin-antitoxin system|nr:type II toxin-antitoxin system VapC family toxin [Clostridiales bacterium]